MEYYWLYKFQLFYVLICRLKETSKWRNSKAVLLPRAAVLRFQWISKHHRALSDFAAVICSIRPQLLSYGNVTKNIWQDDDEQSTRVLFICMKSFFCDGCYSKGKLQFIKMSCTLTRLSLTEISSDVPNLIGIAINNRHFSRNRHWQD